MPAPIRSWTCPVASAHISPEAERRTALSLSLYAPEVTTVNFHFSMSIMLDICELHHKIMLLSLLLLLSIACCNN